VVKKSEVTIRSKSAYGWAGGVPAVNVKWSPYLRTIVRKYRDVTAVNKQGDTYHVHEFGDDPAFWEWVDYIDEHVGDAAWEYPNGIFYRAEEIAREVGWDDAIELAHEEWGDAVKVWSSGRSGGWLVVDGLADVEDWDAIELARWRRFQGRVEDLVAYLDYQFVWHLYVNVYEHFKDLEEIA
jgi:hypothetical protein